MYHPYNQNKKKRKIEHNKSLPSLRIALDGA